MKKGFILREPPIALRRSLVLAALKWITENDYKLPPPTGPGIKEIHVPATLIPGSFAVDVLVFDAWTKRLKAVEFDYYNGRDVIIKRVEL